MDKVILQIKKTIVTKQLIEPGDKVLIACSGGADSLCLFYALLELKDDLFFQLVVAHLNHGLRGKESEGDLEFVKNISFSHNIPFISDTADVKSYAKKHKLSQEEAGRKLRYDFLFQAAYKLGANRVALGHHLDDKVETFLFRLIRGAGVAGLCSINYLREEKDIYFIRPLLDISKKEIELFLEKRNLAFRIDSSNTDEQFMRNKIRHNLLPLLEKDYNSGVRKNILKSIDSLGLFNDFVKEKIGHDFEQIVLYKDDKFIVSLDKLAAEPLYLQRELIKKLLYQLCSDVKFQNIEDVLKLAFDLNTGAELALDSKVIAFKEYGRLIVCLKEVVEDNGAFQEDVDVPGELFLIKQALTIVSSYEDNQGGDFKSAAHFSDFWEKGNAVFEAYFDGDKVETYLCVRSRCVGDKIKAIGDFFSKKVKNIFIDQKVPKWVRGSIPIFCAGDDIIWVTGYRIAEKYKVTSNTKRILKLLVKKTAV